MFGLFKKPKEKTEKMIHPELGELEDIGFWLGHVECKMFGKIFELKLYLFVDEDMKTDISAQLESYRKFCAIIRKKGKTCLPNIIESIIESFQQLAPSH